MHRLLGILAASDKELIAQTVMELYDMGYTIVTDDENYVFGIPKTKRVTPVLLMAHIDTRRTSDDVVVQRHADTLINVKADKCGCFGADDRAGVYIVLDVAKHSPNKPYILFTTGEETGYIGAHKFIEESHPKCDWFDDEEIKGKKVWEPYLEDLYAVVQFDRKGFNEAAFYGTSGRSDLLKSKVMSLGYLPQLNGTSDSIVIQKALGIAGVNLSCGFLHQHTPDEMLLIPAIPHAIRNGLRLINLIDERILLPEEVKYTSNWPPIAHYPPRPGDDKPSHSIKTECDICGRKRPVEYIPHAMACVCKKCINRVGSREFITRYNIGPMKEELQKERDRSRLANQLVPDPCPLCFETEDLSPKEYGVTFCKKCLTYFYPDSNRVYFWSDRDSKVIYYRAYDNPVAILEMHDPVSFIPLEWCHHCGYIQHRKFTTNYDGFVICHNCDAIRKPN